MNLCFFELLGDADGINKEKTAYKNVSPEEITRVSNLVLEREKCSLLKIKSIKNAK